MLILAHLDDAGRHADDGRASWNIMDHDRSSSYPRAAADPDAVPQWGDDNGVRPDHHIVLDYDPVRRAGWRTDGESHVLPDPYPLADDDIVVYYDAHAMMAEVDVRANLRACAERVVEQERVELLHPPSQHAMPPAAQHYGDQPKTFRTHFAGAPQDAVLAHADSDGRIRPNRVEWRAS